MSIKREASLGSNFEAVDPTAGDVIINGKDSTLLIGTAGILMVDGKEGGTNVALPVLAGYNPISVSKIYKTGTTATGIVVLR